MKLFREIFFIIHSILDFITFVLQYFIFVFIIDNYLVEGPLLFLSYDENRIIRRHSISLHKNENILNPTRIPALRQVKKVLLLPCRNSVYDQISSKILFNTTLSSNYENTY